MQCCSTGVVARAGEVVAPDFEINHNVDDELVGTRNDRPLVTFSEPGYYRVKIVWSEGAGHAGLLLKWKRPGDSAFQRVHASDLYAVHPGMPVGVAVQVCSQTVPCACLVVCVYASLGACVAG